MRRFVSVGLLMLLAWSGVAHAGRRHENWKAVERLGQGVPVEVKLQGEAATEVCRVVSADANALICVRQPKPDVDWDAASGARLVFPRSAVQNVWFLTTSSRHIVAWILTGAAVALIIAACAEGNIAGALLVEFIAAAVEVVQHDPKAGLPRRPPQIHRLLIYSSATP
jgi:hypothetical protein